MPYFKADVYLENVFFMKLNFVTFKVFYEDISFHYHSDPFVGRKVVKGTAKLKKRDCVYY